MTRRGGAIAVAGRLLPLEPPILMGVLNVTPDSFSDGGRFTDPGVAEEHAARMVSEGAAIVDVGGESTRPGAVEVPVQIEIERVVPVVRRLAGRLAVPISVDTRRAEVAERALDAGATMVNDVSGLADDPALGKLVAASGVAVVLMHRRGDSRQMYEAASYRDAVAEVREELAHAVRRAEECGIRQDAILLDPGIGFSKLAEHSVQVLARLEAIVAMGYPVVVGPSRKSFIPRAVRWAADGCAGTWPTDTTVGAGERPDRVGGTAAAVAIAVLAGAHVLRVHDVAVMREAALVARALRAARERPGVAP